MPPLSLPATARHRAPSVRAIRAVAYGAAIAVVLLALVPAPAVGDPQPGGATPHFLQAGVGGSHVCALVPGGDVACWTAIPSVDPDDDGEGPGSDTELAPPEVHGPFTAVSVGSRSTCALEADRVACWGYPPRREVSGTFSGIAVGAEHACAVESGGDLQCWGRDDRGQAPEHVSGPFVAVAAGRAHTCAVKAAGSIACWGDDGQGQAPATIAGSYMLVAAGGDSTCALRSDGAIACFGLNDHGQAPATVTGPFTAVSVGSSQACGLRTTGHIACWGLDDDGRAPEDAAGPFTSVDAGESGTCGLTTEKTLTCWGTVPPLTLPSPTQYSGETPTVGVPLEFARLWATGAPYPTLSLRGNPPPGLTFAADGTLSGTPTSRGVFTLEVVATNLVGRSTTEIDVTVDPSPLFDANGDGIGDLAVGAPGADVGGVADAGAVTILYGAADGSYGKTSLRLTQEDVGEVSELGDALGTTVATAEITGDDFQDLIIGAPGEDGGGGQVVVVHGSATGMTGAERTILRQGLAGAAGTAETGDGFGTAISVGEDGLWVGAPGEDIGPAADAGVVTRFPIPPLRTTGSVQYRQGTRGIPGSPERGDRFGSALAGGGTVIGAPGEDVGRVVDAGSVTWKLTRSLSQNSRGIPGVAERGDQFGAAVATGVSIESEDEVTWSVEVVAVGAPGEDVGAVKDAGTATVFSDIAGAVNLTQAIASQGKVEAGDRFGASVFLVPGEHRLAIGAPGEDVGSLTDAGAATYLWLDLECLDCDSPYRDAVTLLQGWSGTLGTVAAGNAFGTGLSAIPGLDYTLLIGSPGQTVNGNPGAGAVLILNDSASGIAAQEVHEDSPGAAGTAATGDHFGSLPAP